MTEQLVLRADDGGVTTLTLNRPAKLNALNPPLFVELRAHLDAVAGDRSVRCVVLTGAGRAFCAGHDLGSIAEKEATPSPHFEPETVDALEQLPQPTIAKIRGHCYTGGLERKHFGDAIPPIAISPDQEEERKRLEERREEFAKACVESGVRDMRFGIPVPRFSDCSWADADEAKRLIEQAQQAAVNLDCLLESLSKLVDWKRTDAEHARSVRVKSEFRRVCSQKEAGFGSE